MGKIADRIQAEVQAKFQLDTAMKTLEAYVELHGLKPEQPFQAAMSNEGILAVMITMLGFPSELARHADAVNAAHGNPGIRFLFAPKVIKLEGATQ